MDRTSDKHSPRVDEQLQHEEQGFVRDDRDEGRDERRRTEAPGPDEGGVGSRPEVHEERFGAPPLDEVEDRAMVAAVFRPSLFPAHRDQLVDAARAEFADEVFLADLMAVPDRLYDTPTDVYEAVVAVRRQRAGGP
ncbi:MAG TPA: DUF2795 domain-containing protein [Acidimicrobiales bacterium]|nr:DUF2795 domain-containing protein [Acidimicrobiales bacterium]